MKVERTIVACRWRNPDNPSDRKSHSMGRWKQRLKCGGIKSNTLSTVDKDNWVLEYAIL